MEHAEQLLAEAEVKAMILPPLITSIRVWEQLLADAEVKAIAADQLRRLQEERLWECPICHNWFSLDDATRVCTRSYICKCPDMPGDLRRQRDIRLVHAKECPEALEAYKRLFG